MHAPHTAGLSKDTDLNTATLLQTNVCKGYLEPLQNTAGDKR
jgi:hypothetical protein